MNGWWSMDCALNSHSGCIMSVETVAKKVILFVGAHFELISNYAALLVETKGAPRYKWAEDHCSGGGCYKRTTMTTWSTFQNFEMSMEMKRITVWMCWLDDLPKCEVKAKKLQLTLKKSEVNSCWFMGQ